jgi:hypothetical protein
VPLFLSLPARLFTVKAVLLSRNEKYPADLKRIFELVLNFFTFCKRELPFPFEQKSSEYRKIVIICDSWRETSLNSEIVIREENNVFKFCLTMKDFRFNFIDKIKEI